MHLPWRYDKLYAPLCRFFNSHIACRVSIGRLSNDIHLLLASHIGFFYRRVTDCQGIYGFFYSWLVNEIVN